MEHSIKTQGIILGKTEFGESSYTLRVFSSDFGLIFVNAKGAKRPKSKTGFLTGLYSYSEMELYRGRGNSYTLTGGNLIDSFFGISEDIDNFTAAGEITKLICGTLQKDQPEPGVMKLYLSTLYVLSVGRKSSQFVSTCFRIRFLMEQGLFPENKILEQIYPDNALRNTVSVKAAGEAINYIRNCTYDRLYSFTVSDDVFKEMKFIENYYLSEVL